MLGIQTIIKRYWKALLAILLIFIAISVCYIYVHKDVSKPVLVNSSIKRSPNDFAKYTHISTPEAKEVISKMETSQPVVSYYINAPTVQKAAEQTQKAIAKNDEALPKAAIEKSDRTVVMANDEEQKVDVYKLNLNKAHKIKAGVTVIDTKAYPTIGYQAGKVEGLVHFDGANVKGGSLLYTVKEW